MEKSNDYNVRYRTISMYGRTHFARAGTAPNPSNATLNRWYHLKCTIDQKTMPTNKTVREAYFLEPILKYARASALRSFGSGSKTATTSLI